MISEKLHNILGLGMIRVLPEILVKNDLNPGRLKNLLKKLVRETDKRLVLYGRMSHSEKIEITQAETAFLEATGWEGKERAIRTYLAFIIMIASSKKWRKIEDIIAGIVEFQERKMPENRRGMCDHAGQKAFDIWEGLKL